MDEIVKLIEQLMQEEQVPAVQVGIIRGSESIILGSGFRDLDRHLEADANTSFAIGSQTKGFVATALTLLSEEGLLQLDKPIKEYIPEFAMHDSYLTETLTVRDMLSHRSGLARHEFMQQLNIDSFTAEEYIRRFKYLKASAPIRTKMQYSNLMFLLAGYLIERVTGKRWSDFARTKLLIPIGMSETNFSVAENLQVENRALPYCLADGQVKEMPYEDIKAAGSAGGMNSTVSDMLKWIRFNLDQGRVGNRPVVSAEGIHQCHTPHIVMPERSPLFKGELQFQAYGLGWFTECYRGHWVVRHGGGIDGFIAELDLIPELDSGFFICSNLNANLVPGMLQFFLYDYLMGLDKIDWHQRFGEMKKMMPMHFSKRLDSFKSSENMKSLPLENYAGIYESTAYGKIKIELEGGTLVFQARKMKVPLRHIACNAFLMVQEDQFLAVPLQFILDIQGSVICVDVDFEPMVGMIRYDRTDTTPEA